MPRRVVLSLLVAVLALGVGAAPQARQESLGRIEFPTSQSGPAQDLFTTLKGRRHEFQFRMDFINFGNLLNNDWGVSQRLVSTSPLVSRGADAQGRALYRLRVVDNELMSRSLQQTADIPDVWRIQFSLRYAFN